MAEQLNQVASAKMLLIRDLHLILSGVSPAVRAAVALAIGHEDEQACAGYLAMQPEDQRQLLLQLGGQQAGGGNAHLCLGGTPEAGLV